MKPIKLLLLMVAFVFSFLPSFSQENKTKKTLTNHAWLRVSDDQAVGWLVQFGDDDSRILMTQNFNKTICSTSEAQLKYTCQV